MNIFALDMNPRYAATNHCDKHVVKMVLETAQLLSTAVSFQSGRQVDGLYKSTHVNHPCSIWTRESSGNFYWLSMLGKFLSIEYFYRYGKTHKSAAVIETAAQYGSIFPQGALRAHVYCGPEEFIKSDPIESYREYYRQGKAHFAKWTKRDQPPWWK